MDYIDRYFELKINGAEVRCPYFINLGGYLKDAVHAGKGSPEEIEALVNSMTKESDPVKLRRLMNENGIGVECSGFIYNVYDYWLRKEEKGTLADYLPAVNILNPRKYLSRRFKPKNSMGADEFTRPPFSDAINIRNVEPGDLIRTRNGRHVLLIVEVEYENDVPRRLFYAQSNRYTDDAKKDEKNGVRKGVIELDETLDLGKARWIDTIDSYFDDYTFKGFRELMNRNGIFRPKLPILGV